MTDLILIDFGKGDAVSQWASSLKPVIAKSGVWLWKLEGQDDSEAKPLAEHFEGTRKFFQDVVASMEVDDDQRDGKGSSCAEREGYVSEAGAGNSNKRAARPHEAA